MTRERAGMTVFAAAVLEMLSCLWTSGTMSLWAAYFLLFGSWFVKSRSAIPICFLIVGAVFGLGQAWVERLGLMEASGHFPFAVAYAVTVALAAAVDGGSRGGAGRANGGSG